jgi:hypothetical protein
MPIDWDSVLNGIDVDISTFLETIYVEMARWTFCECIERIYNINTFRNRNISHRHSEEECSFEIQKISEIS